MIRLLLFFVIALGMSAAELLIGRAEGESGTTVAIPVTLKTGSAATTGLQLEIEYDEATLTVEAKAGEAARSSSKQVRAQQAGKGRKRLVVFGMNHNNLEDGVVVEPVVGIPRGAAPAEYKVVGKSAVATDSTGASVALQVISGAVVVRAAR